MEDNNGTILLDVNMDDLIASLQELKRQYDANTAAMKALKDAGQQDTAEYVQLTQANRVLKQEMAGVERQIQNEIKAERAQEGSLIQLRAQLANLTKQYDAMSSAERMSASGTALQQKIAALSKEVSGLEANTGRWQRNVGNYKSALEGLSGSFKAAGLSTRGLDQSLKLLNANPIMLFVTALVGALRGLGNAFKGSEEATMEMNETMAAFNPIADSVRRKADQLVKWFNTKWRESMDKSTEELVKFLEALDRMGERFGKDWGLARQYEEGAKAARDLQASENAYIKHKREWVSKSAKLDNEVSELRAKAAEKDKYSAEERLSFLDKAIAKETYKAEIEKKLAEQNLENLRREAARYENDTEMMDKLAQAEADVSRADTALNNTKRSLQRQRQAAIREIEAETAATEKGTAANKANAASLKDQAEALRDELDLIREVSLEEAVKAGEKAREAAAAKTAETYAAQKRALDDVVAGIGKVEDAIDGLDGLEATFTVKVKTEGMDEAKEAVSELQGIDTHVDVEVSADLGDTPSKLDELAASFVANSKTIEDTASALGDSFSSLSSIYSQMAEDESRSEEERAEAARKARMWAKLQIAANSGTAVAKGIASAMDLPFPSNLAAIASTLAAVLSAITQAKALAEEAGTEGYATGGVVGGKFKGATKGPDDTVIKAREGEMVLDAEKQKRLYDIASGEMAKAQPVTVPQKYGISQPAQASRIITTEQRTILDESAYFGRDADIAAALAEALRNMPAPVLDYSEFTRFKARVAAIQENAKIR